MRHARRRDDIVDGEGRVRFKFRVVDGTARKIVCGSMFFARAVDVAHLLDDLEQPRPPGNPVRFQRRRYGETDGLFRAAQIGDDEVGRKRVQSARHALHGGIE